MSVPTRRATPLCTMSLPAAMRGLIALLLALGGSWSSIAAQLPQDGFLTYRPVEAADQTVVCRTSVYVPMRDGVRRAVDIYLPPKSSDLRRSVIYMSFRYNRAEFVKLDGGRTAVKSALGMFGKGERCIALAVGTLDQRLVADNDLVWLFRHGYAVVIADMRGAGASFGDVIEQYSRDAINDERDLLDWIGVQPWSNGKIGMFGVSYGAEIQYVAAASGSSYLKALFPCMAEFDELNGDSFYVNGGIPMLSSEFEWFEGVVPNFPKRKPGEGVTRPIIPDALPDSSAADLTQVPVDDDPDGILLKQALREHYGAISAQRTLTVLRLLQKQYDGTWFTDTETWYHRIQDTSPNQLTNFLPLLNAAQVPTYVFGGWLDLFTNGNLRFYTNLNVPKKMLYGWFGHGGSLGTAKDDPRRSEYHRLQNLESLRWFDYWLRDSDSNIMAEPPIHLALVHSPQKWDWLAARDWPLGGTAYQRFALEASRSGTITSQNDGTLLLQQNAKQQTSIARLKVDYSATSGINNRVTQPDDGWDYGDRTPEARKGLTYTTAVLSEDLCVVGHPVLSFRLTATAPVVDIFAYLEEVLEDGSSRYITSGYQRSSFREYGHAPYNDQGMPYPIGTAAVVNATPPLPRTGAPARMQIDLFATAYCIPAGHRLRLTLTGADHDNAHTKQYVPAPTISINEGGPLGAAIVMPVLSPTLSERFRIPERNMLQH